MRARGPLRSLARSLLGDGMLERARAMSLALLGATAALGLGMLALVFNQGWPLVAGGPVPPLPPRHQQVAKARVAVPAPKRKADEDAPRGAASPSTGESPEVAAVDAPAADSAPQSPSEMVVVPSAPVERGGDAPSAAAPRSPSARAPSKPAPTAPAEAGAPAPSPAPGSASLPDPQPESPPATVSEAPPESSVPAWSNGKGHAYGRGDGQSED